MHTVRNVGERPYEAAAPIKEKTWAKFVIVNINLACDILIAVLKCLPIAFVLIKNIILPPKPKVIRGQIALVTGGANGLGRGLCLSLAKKGCNVVVADLDIKNAEKTAADCRNNFKVKAKAYKLDVQDHKAVAALRLQIEEDIGPVDILVNNAGLLALLSLREGTPEDIQRIVNVNLTSHFWTIRVFIDGMIERRRGHIVGISSLAGQMPSGRGIAYCATKHGVRALMEGLYDELCMDKLDDIICTTTVYPYFINTSKVISDLAGKISSMDKLPITPTEYASDVIVGAIRRNNKSLMIPRFLFPIVAFIGYLPIELQQMIRSVIIAEEIPSLCKED